MKLVRASGICEVGLTILYHKVTISYKPKWLHDAKSINDIYQEALTIMGEFDDMENVQNILIELNLSASSVGSTLQYDWNLIKQVLNLKQQISLGVI